MSSLIESRGRVALEGVDAVEEPRGQSVGRALPATAQQPDTGDDEGEDGAAEEERGE
ncbi:hypothetical protein IOD13_02905 [Brevibacterium casei]|nr:hypothetical protein [Brevibacterium casei]